MNKKRAIPIVLALIAAFVLALVFFPKMLGTDKIWQDMFDDSVDVTYHKSNGEVVQYKGTNFPAPERGELIEVNVALPEIRRAYGDVFCYMYYHAATEVYFEDELLYSFGKEEYEKGAFIGSVYVQTPIPQDAWGKSLTIRLYPSEGGSEMGLDHITVVPMQKSYLYFIKGHEVLYIVFFALIVVSVFLTITLVATCRFHNSQICAGIFASVFAMLVSLWMFSYYGMNRLIINDQRVCAHMEYILLYLAPAAVAMYMYAIERSKKEKAMYLVATCIYVVTSIVLTVLNYATSIHFAKSLFVFHILLAIGCVFIIWSVYSDMRNSNIGKVYTRYGISVMIVAVVLDLIRFSIKHYTMADAPILYISLVPVGITLFVASMSYGFIKSFLEGEINRNEREQLTQMAYTDGMTGLSNRASYNQKIEEMRQKNASEFALIFFDLNNLKKANDEYGHDMGDAYIKEISILLRKTFKRDAFCARLGGDEFIAIIEGPRCRMVSSYLTEFDEAVANLDASKAYPFSIAAPHGTAISTKKRVITVDEAVKLADERMYDAKSKSKKQVKED